MPVVIMNKIKAGDKETFETIINRFKGRAGLVDSMPGFQGIELLVDKENLEILVMTRWRSRKDMERWLQSTQFKQAHPRREGKPLNAESEGIVYEVIDV